MNPITPPTSSPAKRKRSHIEPNSPVTPTRPRLQIPDLQQRVSDNALSPRAQVAGRFRNLSIQKEEQSPQSFHMPPTNAKPPLHQRPHVENLKDSQGLYSGTITAIRNPDADALLCQLSDNQGRFLTGSSLSHGLDRSSPLLPVQISSSRQLTTPPFQPLTDPEQDSAPPLTISAPQTLSQSNTPSNQRLKSLSPSNKAAKTASSPSPTAKRARSPPPPPPSMDSDSDDMTGVNGIGYRPTPAQAYARAQKRRQQVKEWKMREEREMRGRRAERRRGGMEQMGEKNQIGSVVGKGGAGEVEGERKVRFVGVMG